MPYDLHIKLRGHQLWVAVIIFVVMSGVVLLRYRALSSIFNGQIEIREKNLEN